VKYCLKGLSLQNKLTERCILLLKIVVLQAISLSVQGQDTLFDRGLLWRIEKQGYPSSYLLGTIHSEDKRVLELPTVVSQKMQEVDTLVLEAPVGEWAGAASLQTMLFDGDTRLSEVLSPELYKRTIKAMVDSGYPKKAADRLKPWAVSITLSVPRPKTGLFLDRYLAEEARKYTKAVKSLETVTEQLAILNGFSLDEQITMLEDTLRDLPQISGFHEALIQAYLKSDLRSLVEISEQAMGMGSKSLVEKVRHRLIVERNVRMVQRLEPMLRRESLLVAIGALHLPGRSGLLALLAGRGYSLTVVY
jgi:uncharacterized protein YbaP (TraB family)